MANAKEKTKQNRGIPKADQFDMKKVSLKELEASIKRFEIIVKGLEDFRPKDGSPMPPRDELFIATGKEILQKKKRLYLLRKDDGANNEELTQVVNELAGLEEKYFGLWDEMENGLWNKWSKLSSIALVAAGDNKLPL